MRRLGWAILLTLLAALIASALTFVALGRLTKPAFVPTEFKL